MKKLFNTNICITRRMWILCVVSILISTILLARVITEVDEVVIKDTGENIWVPSRDDIAYQDSMYIIIRTTNTDVKNIKKDLTKIVDKLDKKNYIKNK